eukprot:825353-Amphidinium_carterae.3
MALTGIESPTDVHNLTKGANSYLVCGSNKRHYDLSFNLCSSDCLSPHTNMPTSRTWGFEHCEYSLVITSQVWG